MTKKKDTSIAYTVRKSARAKRLRLAVYCDGSVVLTSPIGMRMSLIERFFENKKSWILNKLNFFQSVENSLVVKHSDEDFGNRKAEALRLVERRVRHFNEVLGVEWNDLVIKNQKTRWGSCSKKGNININYKILYLPRKLQDYIIVHEMCHLKEFNHSKKFWRLLESVLPEYQDIKNELRRHELFYR